MWPGIPPPDCHCSPRSRQGAASSMADQILDAHRVTPPAKRPVKAADRPQRGYSVDLSPGVVQHLSTVHGVPLNISPLTMLTTRVDKCAENIPGHLYGVSPKRNISVGLKCASAVPHSSMPFITRRRHSTNCPWFDGQPCRPICPSNNLSGWLFSLFP